MTYAWWAGAITVLIAGIAAWCSEDWWAMVTYYAGQRAGQLSRRRIRRERERRQAALIGEALIDELGALALRKADGQ